MTTDPADRVIFRHELQDLMHVTSESVRRWMRAGRDKQDSERSSGADPVAPPFAVEISEVEAERMVGEPIARITA